MFGRLFSEIKRRSVWSVGPQLAAVEQPLLLLFGTWCFRCFVPIAMSVVVMLNE